MLPTAECSPPPIAHAPSQTVKVTAVGANPIRVTYHASGLNVALQRGEQAPLNQGDRLQLVCEETVESIARRDAPISAVDEASSVDNLCAYVVEMATVPAAQLRGQTVPAAQLRGGLAPHEPAAVGSPAKVSRTAPPHSWAAPPAQASGGAFGSGASKPSSLEGAARPEPTKAEPRSPSKLQPRSNGHVPRSNGHVISHEEAHASPSENRPPEVNGDDDGDAEGQSQANPIVL